MNKIITIYEAETLSSKLLALSKQIVVAGGCFDILHVGHLSFLTSSKKQGDVLFLLLESDERIRTLKGETRPVNEQLTRANILASVSAVDYIIPLPPNMNHNAYDEMIKKIKPAIITTTKGDPHIAHKLRQAALTGGTVIEVTKRLSPYSTTQMVAKIPYE